MAPYSYHPPNAKMPGKEEEEEEEEEDEEEEEEKRHIYNSPKGYASSNKYFTINSISIP